MSNSDQHCACKWITGIWLRRPKGQIKDIHACMAMQVRSWQESGARQDCCISHGPSLLEIGLDSYNGARGYGSATSPSPGLDFRACDYRLEGRYQKGNR